jgi:prepilin-type N-terminal cleavage/methylation domain-containing protein
LDRALQLARYMALTTKQLDLRGQRRFMPPKRGRCCDGQRSNCVKQRDRAPTGFTVLELVVALAVLAVVVLSVVQVSIYTARAVAVARQLTFGALMAADKLEQLRGLAWAYDPSGLAVGDTQTDVTVDPEQFIGGMGLRPSPSDALVRNVAGYCDFLDAHGRSLGGGTQPPRGTAVVRRWAIAPLGASPDSLVIQVRAIDRATADRGGTSASDVTLTILRTRTAP